MAVAVGLQMRSVTNGNEEMRLWLFSFEGSDAGGDAFNFDSSDVRPFVDGLIHQGQRCIV